MLNFHLVLLVDNNRLANKMGVQLNTKGLTVQDAVQHKESMSHCNTELFFFHLQGGNTNTVYKGKLNMVKFHS